jgi:hypothetical protein
MANPPDSITLPPLENPQEEVDWLRSHLLAWLDTEYLPEPANRAIADRVVQVFLRQRLEGEVDLGSMVMAILTELQAFDFSQSFYGEFTVANAVGDLLCDRLGIDRCCGRSTTLDISPP